MSVVRHVQEFLWSKQRGAERTPDPPQTTSYLFRCRSCKETYISDAMDSCPQCDTTVETIPSERDLGFV